MPFIVNHSNWHYIVTAIKYRGFYLYKARPLTQNKWSKNQEEE